VRPNEHAALSILDAAPCEAGSRISREPEARGYAEGKRPARGEIIEVSRTTPIRIASRAGQKHSSHGFLDAPRTDTKMISNRHHELATCMNRASLLRGA